VRLQGTVRVVEVDTQARQAVLRLEGSDRGIGGNVAGDMKLQVVERSEYECELIVHTDVTISGKLGQFGQAVMVKKADQITEAFVQAFSRQLARETVLVGSAATVDSALALPAPLGNGHWESGAGFASPYRPWGTRRLPSPPRSQRRALPCSRLVRCSGVDVASW